MFVITGITGNVGGEVARNLLAAGRPVRAVVRDLRKGEAWAKLGCDLMGADSISWTSISEHPNHAELRIKLRQVIGSQWTLRFWNKR